MPSTYTTNGGLEKPGDGEQSGTWGGTVNINSDIIDVITNGQVTLSLSGTSSTLSTSNAVVSDGQNALIILGGSPSGTHTITIDPNDAEKIYFVYNTTAQSIVFTQGSGGNVTVATGDSKIIYSNGSGVSAAVADLTDHFAMSSVKITGGSITGITDLAVADGGTGASDAATARTNLGAQATITGAATTVTASNLTASRAAVSNASGKIDVSAVTTTELNYVSGVTSAIQTQITTAMPSGGIILWSGSIVSIPTGWLLCVGTSGTPDLRDRFVVGAGSTYAVAATGGIALNTLITAQLPSHSHTFSGTTDTVADHTHVEQNFSTNGTGDGSGPGASCCGGSIENSGVTTLGAGAHNHTVSGTTGTAGSGSTVENRPPYYALAYIMKS